MASLYGHLHFWSLKKYAPFTGVDIGTHLYHEKTSGQGSEDGYLEYRKQWAESRAITWNLKNRRPEKLKDGLKDLEDILMSCPVACIRWRTVRNLQLLLSNGTFISCTVSQHSGDLERIFLDKSLVGKVIEHIHYAVITNGFILCSFVDKSKLCYVHFPKKPSLETKKEEKLSTLDPKISYVDLPSPTGRRVKRNLSVNKTQELVVSWWATASEEAWPWSPITTEQNRSNLVILGVNGPKLDILCYITTDSDPLGAHFSLTQPYHVLTVEQVPIATGDNCVDSCIYEYNRNNRIEKVTATPIPLKAPVVKVARNHAEDKLFLACEDGTLMLYDDHRKVTQITKAKMTPCIIQWHPADVLVLVASAKGEIKFYDMALAPVLFQIASENPTPQHLFHIALYFNNPYRLLSAHWSSDSPASNITEGALGCHDNLVLLFDRGPICILRIELGVVSQGKLGAMELVREYINHEQPEEAVNFLNSMNWNTEGKATFACMTIIMNYLLKQPLDPDKEGLLEETLGSFYAPSRPLSEVTVMQYRDPISRLSRRFFHHLLRYKRFEKAYLLAVDIGAKDLFMDIHYLAADVGNKALAEVAKQKAIQIDNEASASDTGESYDDDDDEAPYDEYEGDFDKDKEIQDRGITDQDLEKTLQDSHYLDFDTTPIDELGDEYTAWTLSDHYGQYQFDDDEEDEDSPGSSLKIVHFGLV